jgi:hypothetical protein
VAKLAVGEIWQATIAALNAQMGAIIAIAAPFSLLVDMVLGLYGPAQPTNVAGFTPRTMLILVIIPGLIGAIAQLAVAHMIALPAAPPRQALGAALATWPRYIGAMLAMALPAGLIFGSLLALLPGPTGVVVLVVPVLYLTVRLFPLIPIIVLERASPVAALRRAWGLTRGHVGSLAMFLALVLLFLFGASFLAQGVGAAIGSVFTLMGVKAVGGFGAALVTAVVAMLVSIGTSAASTIIYLRLR